jgi:hypothetical protein
MATCTIANISVLIILTTESSESSMADVSLSAIKGHVVCSCLAWGLPLCPFNHTPVCIPQIQTKNWALEIKVLLFTYRCIVCI